MDLDFLPPGDSPLQGKSWKIHSLTLSPEESIGDATAWEGGEERVVVTSAWLWVKDTLTGESPHSRTREEQVTRIWKGTHMPAPDGIRVSGH